MAARSWYVAVLQHPSTSQGEHYVFSVPADASPPDEAAASHAKHAAALLGRRLAALHAATVRPSNRDVTYTPTREIALGELITFPGGAHAAPA